MRSYKSAISLSMKNAVSNPGSLVIVSGQNCRSDPFYHKSICPVFCRDGARLLWGHKTRYMPRSRKINLEKVLASLDKPCPKCGFTITPDLVKRVDFERIQCPKCGEKFRPMAAE